MNIASRTPEGVSNQCPVCQSNVRIEPSLPFGDAPCPNCGTLLWFVHVESELRLFDPMESKVVQRITEELGVSRHAVPDGNWQDLEIDTLAVVELIMEMEEPDDPPQ